MKASLNKPELVIVGVSWADGYMVIGSTDLARCEIEAEFDRQKIGLLAPPENPIYTLSVRMNKFVIAYGTTYAEALRNLISHDYFKPDKNELPEPRLELEH